MITTPPPARALTPPMGWNSWDCYGTTVTEPEVLANANYMADHLLIYGWDTVVVDIQWYEPTAKAGGYNADAPLALDDYGRPMPVLARFPSAAGGAGFGPLAEMVHGLGLRFGVHIMRGIPQLAVRRKLPILDTTYTADQVADPGAMCDWNTDNVGLDHDHPGAQAYYNSLIALFAEWGVDFIKADDMLGPYHHRDISAMASAVATSERDMMLSLSPGRSLSTTNAMHLRTNAQMWRISDDLWDRWSDVYDQFERTARWAPFAGPGHWPDADMLPLGRIGIRAERGVDRQSLLTSHEQRTMMTLWCIARSPLMFGGDLPSTSPETLRLLTNHAVLQVLSTSSDNRQVLRENNLIVWTAVRTDAPGTYVAIFSTAEDNLPVELPAGSVGVETDARWVDLWSGEALGDCGTGLKTALPPHGANIYWVH